MQILRGGKKLKNFPYWSLMLRFIPVTWLVGRSPGLMSRADEQGLRRQK